MHAFFNVSYRQQTVVDFTLQPPYPQGQSDQYPLDKELFGRPHVVAERKQVDAVGNLEMVVEKVARDCGSLQKKKGNVCRTKHFWHVCLTTASQRTLVTLVNMATIFRGGTMATVVNMVTISGTRTPVTLVNMITTFSIRTVATLVNMVTISVTLVNKVTTFSTGTLVTLVYMVTIFNRGTLT